MKAIIESLLRVLTPKSVRTTVGGAVLVAVLAPALVSPAAEKKSSKAKRTDAGRTSVDSLLAHRLAHRLAPVLHFGPGERDFPTIPFFTAFDGLDNDGDGERDFNDLSEIAPLAPSRLPPAKRLLRRSASRSDPEPERPRYKNRVSWDSLYTYRAQAIPAVFYRVRKLLPREEREMWRFLRKDVQAWRRFDMDHRWPETKRERVRFQVVEYYFYYLNDQGLQGHIEDIEFVFIFVPIDEEEAERFQVVVGAGHAPRNPNNVSVFFDDDVDARKHILVELGGHASAPDRSPVDLFEIGVDVNWHAIDAWGTRDLLATTGSGFSGDYNSGMTFARLAGGHAELYPPAGAAGSGIAHYHLLPVQPFEALSRALQDPVDRELARDCLQTISDILPEFEAPDPLDAITIGRMRTWNEDLHAESHGGVPKSKHQIWQHRHFRHSPMLILKEHLYRPAYNAMKWGEIGELITWGVAGYPREAFEANLGIITPILDIPVALPGIVELNAGAMWRQQTDGSWKSTFTAGVIYENDYRNRIGWYARLGFVNHREEFVGNGAEADFTLSGGPSLLLWSWDRQRIERWGLLANALRIRIGPRIDLVHFDGLLNRVDLEIRVSFKQ